MCEKTGKGRSPSGFWAETRAILLTFPSFTDFLVPSDWPHWLPASVPSSLPCMHACRQSSGFCLSCCSADAHSRIATMSASEDWCPC